MKKRTLIIWGGLVCILLGINGLVAQKEYFIRTGTTVYLRLAPVDPRSLIQGDYMQLDFEVSRQMDTRAQDQKFPRDGYIVIGLDERKIASYVRRRLGPEDTLQEKALLLKYKTRNRRFQIGSDSFFFEEGQAERFEAARFAEFKVDSSGTSVLMGLLDENLNPINTR